MKKYLLMLIGLGLLSACESLQQEVDPALIDAETEKLVVTCFIAPQDTLLTADVALSKPVLGENIGYDKRVDNATITLSDGTHSVVFGKRDGQYPGQFYYGADPKDFPIVAGQRYTLTVRIPDGRNVTAHCTVPQGITTQQVILDSIPSLASGLSGMDYFLRLNWPDPAGQANYYRITGMFHYLPVKPTYPNALDPTWQSNIIHFRTNNLTRDLVNDYQHDGEQLESPRGSLGMSGYIGVHTLFPNLQQAYCAVDLLHTDANYYQYHEALFRQREVGNNPFAEPVLIPSNIEGGLGCFGAYHRTTKTVVLK